MCFNISSSSALLYVIRNDYTCASMSCIHVARSDLTLGNQQSKLNKVTVNYSSRIQINCLYVSQPRYVFHIISYNGEKHVGHKSYHNSQYYNSVRHLLNAGINPIAEAQVPRQFSGIFKIMSESAPIKIAQDFLLLVHDYTGLLWWSVIFITVTMRTIVTLALSFYQIDSLM